GELAALAHDIGLLIDDQHCYARTLSAENSRLEFDNRDLGGLGVARQLRGTDQLPHDLAGPRGVVQWSGRTFAFGHSTSAFSHGRGRGWQRRDTLRYGGLAGSGQRVNACPYCTGKQDRNRRKTFHLAPPAANKAIKNDI